MQDEHQSCLRDAYSMRVREVNYSEEGNDCGGARLSHMDSLLLRFAAHCIDE